MLRVFKMESVEVLRHHLPRNADDLKNFGDAVVDAKNLEFVETSYLVDGDKPSLMLPDGHTQETNNDAENCKRILDILPGLTPAHATDERLWVTLALYNFREYSLSRWDPERRQRKTAEATHLLNHWFTANNNGPIRGMTRDQAISRLWWTGHKASQISGGEDIDRVLELLLFNSDYRSSILERNSSANSIHVAAAILETTEAVGAEYNRECFRVFMKQVNIIGGRKNLAAMSTDGLLEVLVPVYEKAYNI